MRSYHGMRVADSLGVGGSRTLARRYWKLAVSESATLVAVLLLEARA